MTLVFSGIIGPPAAVPFAGLLCVHPIAVDPARSCDTLLFATPLTLSARSFRSWSIASVWARNLSAARAEEAEEIGTDSLVEAIAWSEREGRGEVERRWISEFEPVGSDSSGSGGKFGICTV